MGDGNKLIGMGTFNIIAKLRYKKLKIVLPANRGSDLKNRFRNVIPGEDRAQK
jgi:hypothetical protein